MSFASTAFSNRPFASAQIAARQQLKAPFAGEFGFAAWTYSKTAKLNAWAWHGLGVTGAANICAWAQFGNAVYIRKDGDLRLHLMQPDAYILAGEVNAESFSVFAETQWLDFGKPGMNKGITGMDFDGQNVEAIEFFMSVDGSRSGSLVLSVPLSQGGWTYSGGTIPVELASTEFKLRFVGNSDTEVQVNRITIYWEDLGDQ